MLASNRVQLECEVWKCRKKSLAQSCESLGLKRASASRLGFLFARLRSSISNEIPWENSFLWAMIKMNAYFEEHVFSTLTQLSASIIISIIPNALVDISARNGDNYRSRVITIGETIAFCIVTSLRALVLNLEILLIIAATVNISITKHERVICK